MLNPLLISDREAGSPTSVEQCFVIPALLRLLKVDDIKLSLQLFGPFMPQCAPCQLKAVAWVRSCESAPGKIFRPLLFVYPHCTNGLRYVSTALSILVDPGCPPASWAAKIRKVIRIYDHPLRTVTLILSHVVPWISSSRRVSCHRLIRALLHRLSVFTHRVHFLLPSPLLPSFYLICTKAPK